MFRLTQFLRPLCLWQLFVSLLRVGWVAMSCCDTEALGWDKIFSCFDANAHLRLCFVNHQFWKCSSVSSLWESHFVFWNSLLTFIVQDVSSCHLPPHFDRIQTTAHKYWKDCLDSFDDTFWLIAWNLNNDHQFFPPQKPKCGWTWSIYWFSLVHIPAW